MFCLGDKGVAQMKINKMLAAISVLLVCACFAVYGRGKREGNGDVISRERTVKEFTGVALRGAGGKMNIHFADTHRVVVTTDSNIQDIVTTVTRNNRLTVNLKMNVENADVIINVYLPTLDKINLKGVGNIYVENGSGLDLEIRHTGVGGINAEEYRVENATIISRGVGDINVWAVNSLDVKRSGVGSIRYRGSPRMNMNFNGVGGIEQIKEFLK
jgi:hypothetical protein